MHRFEKELIGIDNSRYTYPDHEVRAGLTFCPEQQDMLAYLYGHHLETLPYLDELVIIDAFLQPENDPDFNIGANTPERTFVMEMLDPISAGHMRSVGDCAIKIAEEMGYNEVPPSHIFYGGYLHDVKKLGNVQLLLQPDYFTLHQQGLLLHNSVTNRKSWTPRPGVYIPMMDTNVVFTPDQKRAMRAHAVEGGTHLRRIGYPESIAVCAEQHHAYFGFMNAEPHPPLAPEERNILGQIMNAADFAVTSASERVYKPENQHRHTVRYLRLMAEKGKISPHIVRAYERAAIKTNLDWMKHTIHLPNVGGGMGLKAVFGD